MPGAPAGIIFEMGPRKFGDLRTLFEKAPPPTRKVISRTHGPIGPAMISHTTVVYDNGDVEIKSSQWAKPSMGGLRKTPA
ncbi:MAG: hypothetical protein K2W95_31010 [Candidatus Obscuribacterales bacterium]|nr:hypothetical protein [Candidatus Obscuribacterales bacterium]